MNKILLFLKKLRPNQKVFIDLLLIFIVFGLLNSFYQKRYPSKTSYKTDDFYINFTLDRKLYKEDSLVNLNIDIRNRKKEKLVKLTDSMNYEFKIFKGKKLILKKYLFEGIKEKKIYFEEKEKKRYSIYIPLGENNDYVIEKGIYRIYLDLKDGDKILELPLNVVQGD